MKKIWTGLAAAVVAVVILGCGAGTGDPIPGDPIPGTPATTRPTASPATTRPTTPATTRPTTPATSSSPAATTAPPPVVGKVSVEEANAAQAAEQYLNGQSFSRKGLIEQLVYEGYSKKAATSAVDSLDVDWMAQAVLTAQNYLNGQSFSKKGLIAQLKFEGFTTKQAEYGVSKTGL